MISISFLNILNTIWPILVAILVFGLIIFIHEFGHFLFAKLFKIRVNEFAIGFGPAFLKFKRKETQYAVRVLPFGGYCAMEGENEDSDDPHAFNKAKVWKRIIVVAAGAVFNLILGFILMLTIVLIQGGHYTTTIRDFSSEATSNQANGLRKGDRITSIDGRRIYTSDDIVYMLSSADIEDITVEVVRDGEKLTLEKVQFPVVESEGHTFLTRDFNLVAERNTFGSVIKQSFLKTVSMGRLVWISLIDLISGKYGLNDVSGPVGVTQVVSDAVTTTMTNGVNGLLYLFQILCMITVNLGIFNLLPIPALDGSRIWFLVVEGIRGKPVKHEAVVHAVGMAILLLFMVVIVFKDLYVWIF